MNILVTGAAGFIGSAVVDRLLGNGHRVVGLDNFSTGQHQFLLQAKQSDRFTLVEADTTKLDSLVLACRGTDLVYHFAANADVRFGLQHPRRDLDENTVATFNVLEAMRLNGVRRIVFASTGSIYGEPTTFPTPENVAIPVQTSLYGASKIAGEAFIQAYCEGFGFQAFIFRFVSILGERYSHGHVFDFYKQLRSNPHQLTVLGNGKQRKSYLHIQDCIDAIELAVASSKEPVNIFNLGTDEYCEVNQSIEWITSHLGLDPIRSYGGGDRGWVGDNPFIFLDTTRIRSLGWKPRLSIREGVLRTVEYLQANQWLLSARS